METDLKCECCDTNLLGDFSNNVWCPNDECLIYDKCYSYSYMEARMNSKMNNEKPRIKETIGDVLKML